MFGWRRLGQKFLLSKMSTWWQGFMVLLVGYIGTIPEALATEPFSWWTFVWSGLITSAEAMLMWQLLGKKILPKVFGEEKKDPEEEETA